MTLITHNKKCNIKKNETQQTLESRLESVLQKQNKEGEHEFNGVFPCDSCPHIHGHMCCQLSLLGRAYWVLWSFVLFQ